MALTERPTSRRPSVRLVRAATPAIARIEPSSSLTAGTSASPRILAPRASDPAGDHSTVTAMATMPDGNHHVVARPQIQLAGGEQDGTRRDDDGDVSPALRRGDGGSRLARDGRTRLRQQHADAVEGDADTAGERQQPDRSAQQRGVDAPALGEPTGDAEENAIRATPSPRNLEQRRRRRSLRFGRGGRGHRAIVAQRSDDRYRVPPWSGPQQSGASPMVSGAPT